MNIKSFLLIIGFCAGMILLTGCGGSSEKTASSDQPGQEKKAGTEEKAEKTVETDVVAVTKTKIPGEDEFVMINLGQNDSIKVGQEFTVTRGKTYICNVVIKKVFDTSSIGRIIPESLNQDKSGVLMKPKRGDKVKTKKSSK